jgi:hypothetical protein
MKILRIAAASVLLLSSRLIVSAGELRRLGAPDEDFFTASDWKKKPHRQLEVQVCLKGNNGKPATAFPLQKCQGDCDNDDECAGSLKCLQRRSDEPVPGCTGLTDNMNGRDFCYDPSDSSSGSLVSSVGNNGKPSSAFPLANVKVIAVKIPIVKAT